MSVKLVFIHRESQTFNQDVHIVFRLLVYGFANRTTWRFFERSLVNTQELVSSIDFAKQKKFSVDKF